MFAWVQELVARLRPARDAGVEGERLAAAWLEREKHFAIVARNWRSPRDRRRELDLVARDGGALVFIEVKSRPATALVPGYFAAVAPRKKRVLLRAARDYLRGLREKPRTIRFDVVEVVTGPRAESDGGAHRPSLAPEVRHFENVPLFAKEFLRGR